MPSPKPTPLDPAQRDSVQRDSVQRDSVQRDSVQRESAQRESAQRDRPAADASSVAASGHPASGNSASRTSGSGTAGLGGEGVLPRLIGMVHLLPLPGAPRFGGSRAAILDRALDDARILEAAGFDALLVENYGDVPFRREHVEPEVLVEMAVILHALRRATRLPLGVQVLRNDARAALAIAASTGASFIRINVHTGAMLTDQGVIEGRADETLRLRAQHASGVRILADVMVKHAVPLARIDVADAARDAVERGLADGLIVSGSGTGRPVDMHELDIVRCAVSAPVYVGSGASSRTAAQLLTRAHGLIVGTAVKRDGITTAPVDADRAHRFVQAARG